ncbi:hypothetical protein U9M48_025388 [Paspalum notatum var. saurae]|uniref:ATP-dependent DNA helicase n=1 Tax=Paspalum notatum var. saurae TaxID=547442 RepID=A0AAQ3WXH1_PASNO
MINTRMIDRFQGEQIMYHSFDTTVYDPNNYYPSEFLNTLTPNGLPPHVLKLKVWMPNHTLLTDFVTVLGSWSMVSNEIASMMSMLERGFSCHNIPNIGVYLPERMFSHGQLCVALSRATTRLKVKILAILVVDEKKNMKGKKKDLNDE